MNLSEVEVLSPKLGGPLPKRGGMPCPVLPWLKNYTGLSPIGHAQAASSHWDPGFLLHAITWGGRELVRCEQLHVLEHPTFVLPHFQTRSQGHTLVTPAGDFAGPDAFALLLGLARESEKTLLAVKQCNSPADAIRLLVGPHQEEWAHFEQTHAPLSLLDLVQDLSVGGEQRFVAWAPIASAAEPSLQALVSKHEGPISLFVGQTHRIWDGLSPFPRLFEKDLLAFSGDAKDRFLGLDLLRTHHPETQKERLQTERSHGLSCFDDVIAIQCGQINLKQI